MIKYTVIWWDSDEGNTKSMILKSSNFDDAFAEATTTFEFKQYRQVKLSDGSSEVIKDNPHYDPNCVTQTEANPQSANIVKKPTNGSRYIPVSSQWATWCRVLGVISLILGIALVIALAVNNPSGKDEDEIVFFISYSIASAFSCFLSAFLIDVLTDMRHYQKQSAECLQKWIEKG